MMINKMQRLLDWYSPGYATVISIDGKVIIQYHSGGDFIKEYADIDAALDEIATLVKNAHDQLKREIKAIRMGDDSL